MVVTLRFAPSLGGSVDRPLDDFVRDEEVLAVRERSPSSSLHRFTTPLPWAVVARSPARLRVVVTKRV